VYFDGCDGDDAFGWRAAVGDERHDRWLGAVDVDDDAAETASVVARADDLS